MEIRLTITQSSDGNIVMTGEGDFDFSDNQDELLVKAAMAGAKAISETIDGSAGFATPILSGDQKAVEMLKSDKRSPVPAHTPTRKFIDATGI